MANQTLLDLAKKSGNSIAIVESMIQSNPLLTMMPTRGITGVMERYDRRIALPTVGFTGFNQGIASSKSRVEQIILETKILKGMTKCDRLLAEAYREGVNAFRLKEAASVIAAIGNAFNENCYYGASATDQKEFDGIISILNTVANGAVSATGSTGAGESSMYFWGFNPVNAKEGRMPGVEMLLANGYPIRNTDMGLQLIADADSVDFAAYVNEFVWQPGMAVYDTRSVGRLANIDATHLPTVALINSVLAWMHPFECQLITCNKTVFGFLQGLKGTTTSIPWASNDLFLRARYFDGIPIVIDDNITSTEAVVS